MNGLRWRIGFAVLTLGLLIVGIVRLRARDEARAARIDYGRVPDFILRESSGRTIGLHDLSGKVWVADFIFTTCSGPCPRMSTLMRQVQQAAGAMPEVKLISFTVDPERSEEHTSELQSRRDLVCRLLLEKKKTGNRSSDLLCRS